MAERATGYRNKMIERLGLSKAIDSAGSIGQSNSHKQFMWSGIDTDQIDIGALHIQGVGLVTLPVKQSDIVKIAKKFSLKGKSTQRTNFEKTCCKINASEITIIRQSASTTQQEILEIVTYNILERMLGISFDNLSFVVETKLEQLLICANEESYKQSLSSLNEPDGKFGTLVLNIPLKLKKPSGKIIVNDGTQETVVEVGDSSCFATVAVAGRCSNGRAASYSVHTGPDEAVAVLVYHLVWSDHVMFGHNDILPPMYLPEFLKITSEIETALSCWRQALSETSSSFQRYLAQPDFFCLPVSGLNRELDLSKLSIRDVILVKSLMSITYLDVHFACIEQFRTQSTRTESEASNGSMVPEASCLLPYSSFRFEKAIHSPHRIADGILTSAVQSVVTHLFLIDGPPYGARIGFEPSTFPVIVIRPRGLERVIIPQGSSVEKQKFKVEFFMESLVSRVNHNAEKNVLDNFLVKKSLYEELRQIVNFVKQRKCDATSSPAKIAVCSRCFYARLFDTFRWMNAEYLAYNFLLEVLINQNLKDMFVCQCSFHPYDRDAVDSFAKFISFTKGWEKYSDKMKPLVNRMLAYRNCEIIVRIALDLMRNNFLGASETFQAIVESVRNSLSKPEKFIRRKLFHYSLVPLAIHLHKQKKTDQQALDVLLSGIKLLEPTQLTNLMDYLGKCEKEESLDCKFFIKGISNIVLKNSFQNFTPQQFLTIAGVYRSMHEQEIVKSFWNKLCSRCIDLFVSNETNPCLFCGVLKESKTFEALNQIVDELKDCEDATKAVKYSLNKISRHPEQFTVANCIDYLDSVLLIEERGLLAEVNFVELISYFFSLLSSGILDKLAKSLFRSQHGNLSLKRDILKSLMERISVLDSDVILQGMDVENILFRSAWFGALDVVNSIVNKLDLAITSKKKDHSSKVALICKVLNRKMNNEIPASSLKFRRDVFQYLVLECFKSLAHLFKNRSSYCVECFYMLTTSERSFIDPIPASVYEQWKALAKNFTLSEAATIVKNIFDREIVTEEASLKKFPSSWNAFKELCFSLLSKWQMDSRTFSSSCCVAFTQCFFWIDEEDSIIAICHRINQAQRSCRFLADVHSAIIRDKRTIDLASSSVHATLAFNDLIDTRIKILNEWLTDSAKRVSFQPVQSSPALVSARQTMDPLKTANSQQQSRTMEPARKQRKLDPTVLPSNSLEANWQKEIDELQSLRKQIFTKSLLNQSQSSSKS